LVLILILIFDLAVARDAIVALAKRILVDDVGVRNAGHC
jgi:hypothetical protein